MIDVDIFSRIFFYELEAFPYGCKVAQAEEVHLQQAERLYLRHVELGRESAIGHDQRNILVHRGNGYDYARGVRGAVPCETFQYLCGIYNFFYLLVFFVDLAEVRTLFKSLVQGYVQIFGYHLGYFQRARKRHVHYLRHILKGGARLKGSEGGYLRYVVHAVEVLYVVYNLSAALYAKVQVYVGHGYAFYIEEALENQVEMYGFYVGDFQTIGNYGSGAAAATRPHHYSLALGVVYEIPNY